MRSRRLERDWSAAGHLREIQETGEGLECSRSLERDPGAETGMCEAFGCPACSRFDPIRVMATSGGRSVT